MLARRPASIQEFSQHRVLAGAMVQEQPMPKLVGPDVSANAVIPAHRGTKAPVGMGENSQERLRPKLGDRFNQLYPEKHPPIRHILTFENLVLGIPEAQVGLDNAALGLLTRKRSPTMRGGIKRLELVGVVGEDLPQGAPVIPVGGLREVRYPGGHGDDVVLSQQADRLAVNGLRATLADRLESPFIRALDAEQKPGDPGLFIQVQDIRIADDIARSRRTDQDEWDLLSDERLQEGLPGSAGGGGILIGKVDNLHPVLAVQACEFGRELHWVAVPPRPPKIALTAVAAMMRTATGELHYHGATVSPIAVTGVVDQFPANPIGIQIPDHCGRGSSQNRTDRKGRFSGQSPGGWDGARAEYDPWHLFQGLLLFKGCHETDHGFLTFTSDNEVEPGLLLHNLKPMVGWVHATIDDPRLRHGGPHGSGDLSHTRVPRSGARVTQQNRVRVTVPDLRYNAIHGHRAELGVQQLHLMSRIE